MPINLKKLSEDSQAMGHVDFKTKVYNFDDIPKKRKYILERCIEIYPELSKDEINNVLNKIKIILRDQKEKGASNHKTKIVYIGLKELEKYAITDEQRFLTYLISPYSSVVHETSHIFQNVNKEFPHIQYNEKKDDGNYQVNYDKYVKDPGEIQARTEHIIELLKWGFTKSEIVEFLYSRKYEDRQLWREMVGEAQKIIDSEKEK
jgi:hypothetical protein